MQKDALTQLKRKHLQCICLINLGLGCGWCYDKLNPTKGQCLSGSFNMSNSLSCPDQWAYAKCPDIDECQLGKFLVLTLKMINN